jgi:hypothetical protein
MNSVLWNGKISVGNQAKTWEYSTKTKQKPEKTGVKILFKNSISVPVVFVFLNRWLFLWKLTSTVTLVYRILAQIYCYNPIIFISHAQTEPYNLVFYSLSRTTEATSSFLSYNRLKAEYSAFVFCVVSVQKQNTEQSGNKLSNGKIVSVLIGPQLTPPP